MVHLSVVITAVNGGLLSRARLDDSSRTMYKIDRQFSWRKTRHKPRDLWNTNSLSKDIVSSGPEHDRWRRIRHRRTRPLQKSARFHTANGRLGWRFPTIDRHLPFAHHQTYTEESRPTAGFRHVHVARCERFENNRTGGVSCHHQTLRLPSKRVLAFATGFYVCRTGRNRPRLLLIKSCLSQDLKKGSNRHSLTPKTLGKC